MITPRKIALAMMLVSAGTVNASDESQVSIPDYAALQWRPLPNSGAIITYANLSAELTGKGPYTALIKVRRGTRAFAHAHSASISKVVLEGTVFTVVDGIRAEHPKGSVLHFPGGVAHQSGCISAVNCLLYVNQAQGYDVQLTPKAP
ncbi:cupin domain-containing protein [Pseudomonas putida]|uniref:cupin domain-containing protein n=1 Tax=Pseudomonas putida TaxID=303 RepID=UPI0039068A67